MNAQLFTDILEINKNLTEKPQETVSKSTEESQQFNIMKTDDEKRLIFGWASVAITKSGEQVVDHQKDIIDPDDLEEAVYKYVLDFRDGGEEHIPNLRKKARMVESCMFTKEKMQAMGVPEGIVPEGWWIGFYVDDDEAWEKVKNGTYQMFSVEGHGIREEVDDDEEEIKKNDDIEMSPDKRPSVAKTFDDILKFNPYHGKDGKFTSKTGGGTASLSTRTAPVVKNPTEFDDYVEKNGLKKIYRGYSAGTPEQEQEYEDNVKNGTVPVSGEKSSALGQGVYYAKEFDEATGYMQRRQQEKGESHGRVITAALDVEAKVGDYEEYQLKKFEEESSLNHKAIDMITNGSTVEEARKVADQAMEIRKLSVPEYAAQQGCDAVYDKATGYTIVTNQNALVIRDNESIAKTFDDILKFNPYHDSLGRFATASGYASFTTTTRDPKKQHWADKAVARMKQQAAQAAPAAPPKPQKPQKNYDKLGYADHDDADYHQLYNGRQYYQQQKLTAQQKQAATNYLEANPEPGSLYSHSQNMNYMMATGQKLTGKYKQTYDGIMSSMHNLGYNVELTRYDHDGMINGMLSAIGARGTVDTLTIGQIKKALVGTTMNENKLLSVSYNDFKAAPVSSTNVFTNRRVKITYKAKASTQAMMPGNGPGGNLGELILAPTNGKSNPGGKIVDIKLSGKKARNKGSQIMNKQQIEIVVEI